MGRHKVKLELLEEAQRRLAQLAWLLNEPPEELLQRALALSDGPVDERELAALEGELVEGERRFTRLAAQLSQVHGRYAAVKFELFEEFQRNRPLVVNLAGALAENRRLRRALGRPEGRDDGLVRELDCFFNIYIQRDLTGWGAEGASEADGGE